MYMFMFVVGGEGVAVSEEMGYECIQGLAVIMFNALFIVKDDKTS